MRSDAPGAAASGTPPTDAASSPVTTDQACPASGAQPVCCLPVDNAPRYRRTAANTVVRLRRSLILLILPLATVQDPPSRYDSGQSLDSVPLRTLNCLRCLGADSVLSFRTRLANNYTFKHSAAYSHFWKHEPGHCCVCCPSTASTPTGFHKCPLWIKTHICSPYRKDPANHELLSHSRS